MAQTLIGMPASPGIVIGPVYLLCWEVPDVPHRVVADDEIEHEIARLHGALSRARERVHLVRDRAARKAGPDEAAIFDAQLLILEDHDLIHRVESLIRQNLGAEKAFDLTILEWRQRFARHAAAMMRERVGDITDVQIRVLSLLMGLPDHDPVEVPPGANAILVTHDLTPTITVQLDRSAIAAIATDAGTRTSHVAILARSLGMPAVVGLRDAAQRLHGGDMAVLDGTAGTLTLNPSAADVDAFHERSRRDAAISAELALVAAEEPVTTDGVRLIVRANVDLPEEAGQAVASGAEGVGLMRTEFLVVGRTGMPDEEEQYRAYRAVVEAFQGRPVVIRTFDIGGDKYPVGGFASEANPFLGWRAIRVSLDAPDLFMPQLRALLRAAVHGDLRIMLPLVVSVQEVHDARAMLHTAARELSARGVPFRADIPLGVMIETPAAAIGADTFVGVAEFFSIGTNDLVQYTLAVDRGNANLAPRFTPLHPSVLRLIRRTLEVGTAHGLDVTVCGEMASQPLTAFALIGLGLRQLSVAPGSVGLMKRIIRSISASDAASAAAEALEAPTAAAAEALLMQRLRGVVGDVLFLHDGLPGMERPDNIRG
ncbi:MAG TPA: phosphoenolpyruvate--protein phosphotransferase [Gemmatimonadaceae bacterium]|nr:phosphoenolpyruvate--protein phosphotransferase [Gemmatimonadaceae bacterium]